MPLRCRRAILQAAASCRGVAPQLCFGPLIAGACQVRFAHGRGQGPFRGLSLIMVFGVGASTCGTKCEGLAFRRNTEVTDTTVPAGTRPALLTRRP